MVLIPNCLIHVVKFLNKEEADSALGSILKESRNHLKEISGGGRKMARYGKSYTYRGRELPVFSWTEALVSLKDRVSAACQGFSVSSDFNACVMNMYPNEHADLPLHADITAIPQLGREPVIACVSLGSSRPFMMLEKKTLKQTVIELQHGDLYIMHGVSQTHYKHGAPLVENLCGPRVSVTYRNHLG